MIIIIIRIQTRNKERFIYKKHFRLEGEVKKKRVGEGSWLLIGQLCHHHHHSNDNVRHHHLHHDILQV